ncbi:MAG: hypothetical protein ACYSYL_12685, partial [Planctomycetota bacterium]
MVSQARQRHAAKQDVQDERPVVADRDRDQSQRPQKLGDGRGLVFNNLPDLVYLVREGRVHHAHSQLRARE